MFDGTGPGRTSIANEPVAGREATVERGVEPPGGEVRNEALVQDEPSVLTQAAGMLPGAVDVAEPTTTALAPAQQVATGCSVLS